MTQANIRFKAGDENTYDIGELVSRKKAKAFYSVKGHPDLMMMRHLDIVTSDDGGEKEKIVGKGRLNSAISSTLFELLSGQYVDSHQTTPIKTHYVGLVQNHPESCIIRRMAQVIPIEVIVRNRAYGSFIDKYGPIFGVNEGAQFEQPTCEFTLKDDARHDPIIPWDHIVALNIATEIELKHMREVALAVNQILIEFFKVINIDLVDFKLVFGRQSDVVGDFTNLRIIGEISPDTCRLRDIETKQCLDKDIFRRGLPGLSEAYEVVSQKIAEHRRQQEQVRIGIATLYDADGVSLK